MAITASVVITALKPIVIPSPLGDGTQAIGLDGGFVPLDSFVTLFANATDMTAASLNAIDDGKLGYASYITEWQTVGYIK